MSERKPTIIKEFPGRAVDLYLKTHGHLPSEHDYERVKPTNVGTGVQVLDRTKPFDGKCELCTTVTDLRPYGPAGEWICFSCGQKDEAMTQKRMGQILFGDKSDA